MTENYKKLGEIFSKILQIDIATLSDVDTLDTLATWDSFNALVLITDIEKAFGVKFSMEEIVTIKTLHDIKELLKKNNIGL